MPEELDALGVSFVSCDRSDVSGLHRLSDPEGHDLLIDCVCFTANDAEGLLELAANAGSTVMISSKAVYIDEAYVARRQVFARMPGAWESTAAARFKSPFVETKGSGFGQADATPYEQIAFPTLMVAGKEDRLRETGYADELGRRIPDCELHVLEECGHCPNIEMADAFNEITIRFLKRVNGLD